MVCMSEPQEGGGGEGAEFLNISYSLVAFKHHKRGMLERGNTVPWNVTQAKSAGAKPQHSLVTLYYPTLGHATQERN